LGFIESEEDRIIEAVEQEVIEENLLGADAEESKMRINVEALKHKSKIAEKEKEEKEIPKEKELEISFKQKHFNKQNKKIK